MDALADPADRAAFRRRFCWLAERCFYEEPPREVVDCSALLRYAYREALRADAPVPLPPLKQKLAPLFQTEPGVRVHFADARNLMRHNAARIGRGVSAARPGDLLFYEQLSGDMPFHAMAYLGASQFGGGPGPFVVYHTGPVAKASGEIRRPTMAELSRHPEPRWRPLVGNPYFLGVFRWSILRESS